MYNILKNHIAHSKYDLPQVLDRIKALYGRMEIDDTQREELETMAREKASFTGSMDTADKLLEMEMRLRAIEEKLFAQDGTEGGEEAEIFPAWQEGKWYYAGDKCSYNGKNYICIAPAGVTCVWSPEAYPAYWEAVA